jgi:hypothetical protein
LAFKSQRHTPITLRSKDLSKRSMFRVIRMHSSTWSGPRSTARILLPKRCLENNTGMYAIHAVLKTTVAAAVYALRSVTRDTLSLTKRELISSVTVETQGDANA